MLQVLHKAVDHEHHKAHDPAGKHRLKQDVHQAQAKFGPADHVDGIRDAGEGVTDHRGYGGALDVDLGDVHQGQQGGHLQHEADKQVEYRHIGLAHALDDAGHGLDQGKEDHPDGGGVHQVHRQGQLPLRQVGI